MMKFKLLLSSALVLGAFSGAALAQDVFASDPEGMTALINDYGYEATLTTDNTGNPKIEFTASGKNSQIYFYDCVNGANCTTVQFVWGADLPDGSNFTMMNMWNQDNRFGEAYLDADDDPFVEYDLDMNGGLTADNFRSIVDGWAGTLNTFGGYIGF